MRSAGSGADTLIANQGANHLTGNGGADLFTWADTTGGGTGALADTIMDFVRGTDKIDLSAIDANPATQADDPFSLPRHGGVHQPCRRDPLRRERRCRPCVRRFRRATASADMEVIVNNQHDPRRTDFVL